MGQLVSGPVTLKDTKTWENIHYSVAASSMQGWRFRMEDTYTCFLNLPGDPSAAYFAVFDGHGGSSVPKYAAAHLHEKIISQSEYATGDLKCAIRRGILNLDAEMQINFTRLHEQSLSARSHQSEELKSSHSPSKVASCLSGSPSGHSTCVAMGGSTCIVLLLKDTFVYCANCGDSRAVVSRLGIAEAFSSDHKPNLPGERSRILAAGGWISSNRVNGNLALSRALGDFIFKRNPNFSQVDQIVSPNPDILCRKICPESDEFIIIGCDGIWDVLTNQEVVTFIRSRLSIGYSPETVCEELMMHCLSPKCNSNGLGCDNMTVVLICLLNDGSSEDIQRRCSRPCPGGLAPDTLYIASI